ncbi:MAG: P-loop NTPase [Coriobacteriia bacterium]
MKTIVVASGKGGTGKTTLSALFAHMAAQHMTVAVVDADVEGSNLPLALHAEQRQCKSFEGGSRAWINPSRCIGCGLCESVCRFGAISEAINSHRVLDRWACEGCGYCAQVCVTGAIEMQPMRAGTACLGSCETGAIAYGQLGPGEDLSGRLVTEVRRLGKATADGVAELLFVDGPPGIGCPVIAAVTNADLLVAVAEPTVSGEHDLSRLIELAKRLGIPVVVALNKADLSEDGAKRISTLAEQRDVPLIARVPFDPALGGVLERLTRDSAKDVLGFGGEGIRAVRRAWEEVQRRLS